MTHAPRSLLRPLYFVMVIVVTVLATQYHYTAYYVHAEHLEVK